MMKLQLSTKTNRQRNLLLLLPAIALPFITLFFWTLGGGKEVQAARQAQQGVNLNLPDAQLNDQPMDKMSYYDQAQTDSAKFLELLRSDPNYQGPAATDTERFSLFSDSLPEPFGNHGLNTSLYQNYRQDPKTYDIYQRLVALDQELRRPPASSSGDGYRGADYSSYRGGNGGVNSADIDRLELMMQNMNQQSAGGDPELRELNGMLEKILDVQHPERVQEKLKQASDERKANVFSVSAQTVKTPVSLLETGEQNNGEGNTESNGFYSLNESVEKATVQNAIQAVVHETQTLVNGSTVKLRLVNDVVIHGVLIPKDQLVFGIASLDGERLNITIRGIRYQNSLYPVELTVCDMDGLDGIHIPGAITRDVAKQSADRSVQTIGLNALDASWQAQAAGAGIEAAKTLFSKKIRLVKVQVKAGYQVLLWDEK